MEKRGRGGGKKKGRGEVWGINKKKKRGNVVNEARVGEGGGEMKCGVKKRESVENKGREGGDVSEGGETERRKGRVGVWRIKGVRERRKGRGKK